MPVKPRKRTIITNNVPGLGLSSAVLSNVARRAEEDSGVVLRREHLQIQALTIKPPFPVEQLLAEF